MQGKSGEFEGREYRSSSRILEAVEYRKPGKHSRTSRVTESEGKVSSSGSPASAILHCLRNNTGPLPGVYSALGSLLPHDQCFSLGFSSLNRH
jgi:hypothetical protein